MSFHHETHVKKTRRSRACRWCYEGIMKGQPSVVHAGVYEGDFCTARYHPECNEAITRYYNTHNCWGEELPDEPMNRGGIQLAGEQEEVFDEKEVLS